MAASQLCPPQSARPYGRLENFASRANISRKVVAWIRRVSRLPEGGTSRLTGTELLPRRLQRAHPLSGPRSSLPAPGIQLQSVKLQTLNPSCSSPTANPTRQDLAFCKRNARDSAESGYGSCAATRSRGTRSARRLLKTSLGFFGARSHSGRRTVNSCSRFKLGAWEDLDLAVLRSCPGAGLQPWHVRQTPSRPSHVKPTAANAKPSAKLVSAWSQRVQRVSSTEAVKMQSSTSFHTFPSTQS